MYFKDDLGLKTGCHVSFQKNCPNFENCGNVMNRTRFTERSICFECKQEQKRKRINEINRKKRLEKLLISQSTKVDV